MKYLTPEQVLFIHARVIDETGGSHGLRDLGLLQAAVARPKASYDGKDLYQTLFEKAAALMHSIIKNHPFVDGNKRVGVSAAVIFIETNGLTLLDTTTDLVEFTQKVVKSDIEIHDMANWFRDNTTKRE